jgi:hypothetical protein
MEKGKKEYVPECAQRWREKAIQVDPLLLEKEIINLFSNTFKAFFFIPISRFPYLTFYGYHYSSGMTREGH